MQSPQNTWKIPPKIPVEVSQALDAYPKFFRQILYNRGIQSEQEAARYLSASSPAGNEPANLVGVPSSVDIIDWHIKRNNKIVVYGDYDVDGVTATALLTDLFIKLGTNITSYIPNRFDEGYGLNIDAIRSLKESGADLVITVDCGIRSHEEAELANKIGLDLIITDHHHPGQSLPVAKAIINPKLPSSQYPDKDLAGVGIAYKLAEEIISHRPEFFDPVSHAKHYLDLVAVGTVADLAPLVNENRAMVRAGLLQLRNTKRQGLRSLIGVAGVQSPLINSTDIGFRLGPRLNAAGRLESAVDALELLLSTDILEAGILAQKLNLQNQERQELTRVVQESAQLKALERDPDSLILIAVDENYNPGVVGLAAARLMEQFHRPSIVGHESENTIHGSCRSIPEFHITNALDECADLLQKYGGHAAAAGFTVAKPQFPEFCERMDKISRRELGALDLVKVLKADLEVELIDLKPDVLNYLDLIEPVGMGNPQVQFVTRKVKIVRSRTVGKDQSHLKFTVTDGKVYFDAIAFRFGHLANELPALLDLFFTFELNEFNGKTYLQLNVHDIHT